MKGIPRDIEPNRYGWVDYAKGIAIFLVIYRHGFEGLKRAGLNAADFIGLEYANIMFFSFRMPLFFIVSGMFVASSLAKRGLPVFAGQKAKTILYPYFLWGALQITVQLAMGPYVNSSRTTSDYLYLLYNPHGVDQFWYLYALFNVTVLYAMLRTFLKLTGTGQLFLGLVFYYLSSYSSQHGWNLEFIQDVLHYYLFLAIGDVIGGFFRNEKNKALLNSFKLFWILLPLFVVTQVYFLLTNLRYDPESYHYIEIFQPSVFLLIVFVGCGFMLSISFLLNRFRAANWLRIVGFHSLYIYVTHVFVSSANRMLLTKVFHITYLPLILVISIALSVILPIALYRLCQAKGWYLVFSLDKERIKKPRPVAIG